MNDKRATANALLEAATQLFAQHGYNGTSVRAITERAGANLGAITYHYGTKDALYEAVFRALIEPMRERAADLVGGTGSAIDRIEHLVRGFFQFLQERPEFARIITQHLAGSRPLPEPARNTMQKNIQLLASLITEGQRDGLIRSGDPVQMALSIAAQPMWLSIAHRQLREGTAINQDDPETHGQLVDSVVHFVRAALCRHQENTQ